MKVLFFTHSFPRYPGDAAGSFILRLAVALQRRDIGIHVVAPGADGLAANDMVDGVGISRFRYAPRKYETLAYTGTMAQDVASSWMGKAALAGYVGGAFVAGLRASRSFVPDVIHAHWWFPSGLVAGAVAGIVSKPLVTTMHGTDVRLARDIKAALPLFKRVMRQSSRVTVVSTWLGDEANSVMPGCMPIVAPMPVAPLTFFPSANRAQNRLLFVGRLNAQKGLGYLIEALALLSDDVLLDVVGDGPDRATLRTLASDCGVAARIVWHGHLDQHALPAMYGAATALVVPSTDEGLGLVAAEALMCETPVIAFRSGGLTDIVEHERTGLLVPPGDVTGLAAAVRRTLADPAEAHTLAAAGNTAVTAAFSDVAAAERYADIYSSIAGKTG